MFTALTADCHRPAQVLRLRTRAGHLAQLENVGEPHGACIDVGQQARLIHDHLGSCLCTGTCLEIWHAIADGEEQRLPGKGGRQHGYAMLCYALLC